MTNLTEKYDVLRNENTKLCSRLENADEILSCHEAYISKLEEENAQLKELLKECRELLFDYGYKFDDDDRQKAQDLIVKIFEVMK